MLLLKKPLYVLNQAPIALYTRFADYVTLLGFIYSKIDHSLFIYHHGANVGYLLLYVDNIILTHPPILFDNTFWIRWQHNLQ